MSYNTITIFDWDDTLYPTTYIMHNHININYFTELDSNLRKLLEKILSYGKVIIITNATVPWVKYCLKQLPRTNELINARIQIISARQLLTSISNWKTNTFIKVINQITSTNIKNNIISIGDADYEYNALVNLNAQLKKPNILKSIKLKSAPSPQLIIKQLKLITYHINDIINKDRHLELNMI